MLAGADYVADRALATVLFLSLRMRRPLFLEGEAGVGKTEIAKVLASALGRRLIRLQCYEGLDVSSAVYEWNYAAQMIEIRMDEAAGQTDRDVMEKNVFSEKYLIRRPVLDALSGMPGSAPVFLIDELDRTDEAFEAFLLEILSDFQVTVPELGTIRAEEPPIVIITTNRTREIDDVVGKPALRRSTIRNVRRDRHPGYSAAVESSALTSLRRRRPSPCSIRAISSWYLSRTPIVSDTVSGSSATLSSSVSAPAQSSVSATPGTLNRSSWRSFWMKPTISAERRLLACGTFRLTISSSRWASG